MINLNNKLKNVKEIIVHMLCTCADDSTTKKKSKVDSQKGKGDNSPYVVHLCR